MNSKHFFISLLITLSVLFSFPAYAREYQTTGVAHTSDVSLDQYRKILAALESCINKPALQDYSFTDTGIVIDSTQEAEALMYSFRKLFLSSDSYCIIYNDEGWDNYYLNPKDTTDHYYSYQMNGRSGKKKNHLMVCWNPKADAQVILNQHYEAASILQDICQSAPTESSAVRLKYYYDSLSDRITYDNEGVINCNQKHSAYDGLINGYCVCSGYAEAFFYLCFMSDIECAAADCTTTGSDTKDEGHIINAVRLNGEWKKIDVTWGDLDPGISYDYFLVPLNKSWQDHIDEPYFQWK